MIIKGEYDPKNNLRKVYPIGSININMKHFTVRTVTKANPFNPHKHEQEELWFILNGEAIYTEDGKKFKVEAGDLIQIKPWVEHGLSTDNLSSWICVG
ncbi:MAG: cupin domain-containing protein [Spirochaetes bacterium]|nr:cupin domain-containing protein [Spirochaetota bacterium]